MKLISHRGNLRGPDRYLENSPDYVLAAMRAGYDVEIDVWYLSNIMGVESEFWLGHDCASYPVPRQFLEMEGLWIHCKNTEAFKELRDSDCNVFWHESDKFAVTSLDYVWTCDPQFPTILETVLMIPDKPWREVPEAGRFGYVCNDWVQP